MAEDHTLFRSPQHASLDRSGQETDVTISKLELGLVCGPRDDRHICFHTTDVQVTNESGCMYNGAIVPCTWYGFSFDYNLTTASAMLECEIVSSEPMAIGNPKAELASSASVSNFQLNLKAGEHHFDNWQYMHAPTASTGQIIREEESCTYLGRKILEFSFTLHLPER